MRPRNRAVAFALAAALLTAAGPAEGVDNRIAGIRFWSLGELTRVSIQTKTDAIFHADRVSDPPRIFFDLEQVARQPGKRGVETIPVGDSLLKRIRIAEVQPGTTRVVLDLAAPAEYSVSQLANPPRIVIEVRPAGAATPTPPVRSTTGEKTLALEPGLQPVRPEPALDLPPAKRGEAPGATRPEPALDLPKTRSTPAAQAAKPEPAIELPQKLRSPLPQIPKPEPATELSGLSTPPAGQAKTEPAKPAASTQPVTTEPVKPEPAPDLPAAVLTPRVSTRPPKREPAHELPKLIEPNPAAVSTHPVASEPVKNETAKPETAPDVPAPAVSTQPLKPEPARGTAPPATALAAKMDSRGDTSLIRALGLKLGRIVLDPGHGGHDTGTIGPGGLQEKDVVLDIAQRLGKLIEQRMASEVVYTRTGDTFVPLEERTRIANEEQADLFLSIHANSSKTPTIAGSETFYLNFTTSEDELAVAARENATSQTSIHELQDLLQNIVKKEKSQESREFASSIQKALYAGLSRGRGKNRGVKKAPFVVLIKASMPSVLAEVAFLSNPREEAQLKRPDYRQRVAEALYRGVAQYANTLSHFRTVTDKPPKPAARQSAPVR
jgi:N-acetylmuramoyl-L-alanine amidase